MICLNVNLQKLSRKFFWNLKHFVLNVPIKESLQLPLRVKMVFLKVMHARQDFLLESAFENLLLWVLNNISFTFFTGNPSNHGKFLNKIQNCQGPGAGPSPCLVLSWSYHCPILPWILPWLGAVHKLRHHILEGSGPYT